jgi:hypothetical protein
VKSYIENKSVSASMTSEVSQNTSQGSFLSEATSINESNIDGEQELVAKFSDFENLSKKWGTSDVDQVKYLLRVILTRKYVSEAGLNAVKKNKEAQKINQSLEKLNPELAKKLKEEKENKKTKSKTVAKKRAESKGPKKLLSPEPQHPKNLGLSK